MIKLSLQKLECNLHLGNIRILPQLFLQAVDQRLDPFHLFTLLLNADEKIKIDFMDKIHAIF